MEHRQRFAGSSLSLSLSLAHTITLHLTFLRRTSVGSARFSIRDVKLGRRTSTVHVSLTQDDDAEPSVVGYIAQSNLDTEEGILNPPPLPLTSTQVLKEDEDPNWVHPPAHRLSGFRKAAQKTKWYLPWKGQPGPVMADE
ncbi:MAG: hypothetical protein Q9166_004083 [cf. Caloplaca sp. 2 TL-2023]